MAALKTIDSLLRQLNRRLHTDVNTNSMLIAIGSTNPTKINSVKMAVDKLFPEQHIEYKFSNVASGVSNQPKSPTESLQGAINRAKNVFALFPTAAYSVGIEGGIETVNNNNNNDDDPIYLQSGWIVVMNQEKQIGIGTSARVEISNKIIDKIMHEKKELGHVMDELTGQHSTKTHQGYFGIVTNDQLPRADAYHHGVLFAFAKFVSPQKYWC